MNGVLVVDKPPGPTSHDIVVRVRRAFGIRRIGHTGTLDPLASGVLPLLIGRAVRLARFLTNSPKEYEAVVQLGIETDTFDLTGEPVRNAAPAAVEHLSTDQIENALETFLGSFLQQPPIFSAKKIAGQRAHRLARRGIAAELRPAAVEVSRLECVARDGDRLTLRLACSAGFYVRSLAHDIGTKLGVGGCLASLRRLRSGEFGIESAVSLDALEADPAHAHHHVMPMSSLLRAIPSVRLTTAGVRRAVCGNLIREADLEGSLVGTSERVRLLDAEGQLVAIAEPTGAPGTLHPAVVVV